jgi:hypothetical protein
VRRQSGYKGRLEGEVEEEGAHWDPLLHSCGGEDWWRAVLPIHLVEAGGLLRGPLDIQEELRSATVVPGLTGHVCPLLL